VTLTPGSFVRVGLILVVAVVLQVSGVSEITILGGNVDLIPLTVAAIAYYSGSVAGAATGFSMGVLLDLVTGQTMGAASLVLTALGYGIGRFRELRDPSHGLMPVPVAAVATLAWGAGFAAVSFMLDIGATVSPLVARDALVAALLNGALALPFFALIRKLLRPSLVVDPYDLRRRRRPARETGAIGLRGLEV
jgi:rod shape-determining protein MreD